MTVREGDPILSKDGKRIEAYFTRGFELPGDAGFSLAVMRYVPARPGSGRDGGTTWLDVDERLIFRAVFRAPDRTYWQAGISCPDDWAELGRRYYEPAPPKPGPDPDGMKAAYDLVLSDIPGPMMTRGEMEYRRGFWEWRTSTTPRQPPRDMA